MSETVDGLKQRVVGAFVILSLGIIFLPMIFNEPHVDNAQIIEKIPPKPSFKTVIIEAPERPGFDKLYVDPSDSKVKKQPATEVIQGKLPTDQKMPSSSSKRQTVVAVKSSKKVNKTSPKVSHLPIFKNVWMVQLGTFANQNNAFRLRDKLRREGFDGHTKNVKLNGKPVVRVFTGPFANKSEAKRIKSRLDVKFKVKSQLIFFDA